MSRTSYLGGQRLTPPTTNSTKRLIAPINDMMVVKALFLIALCNPYIIQSVIMPPRPFKWDSTSDTSNTVQSVPMEEGVNDSADITRTALTIKEGGSIDMLTDSYADFNVNLNEAVPIEINIRIQIWSRPDLIVFVTNGTESMSHRYNETSSLLVGTINESSEITVTFPKNNFGDKPIRLHSNKRAGHAIIDCSVVNETEKEYIDYSMAYVSINIGKTDWLNVLSSIVGWIYFTAWSLSFYFQVILNFQRKSVVGLNFDFLALNLLGFLCYSLYNFTLMFSEKAQQDYYKRNKYSRIPVEYNDLFFAIHAVLLTSITTIQCFIYERGTQTVSWGARIFLILASLTGISLYVASLRTEKVALLDVVLFLSYIKLVITLIKYTPQAYMNYKRKSTIGWSIHNILLDFTGGVLSITQMFLLSYNYDDWNSIFGNFTKFGLGVISISFDVLFVVQHYFLYRQLGQLDVSSDSEYAPEPVISQSIRSSKEQQLQNEEDSDDD